METAKKIKQNSGSKASDESIKSAYIQFLLTEGKQPTTIYKFCLDIGMKEDEFYKHFGSFDGLERHIWKGFLEKTSARLLSDKSFINFTSREKVLAFYFTLLEELKANRSFILLQLGQAKRLEFTPSYLKSFKESFELLFETILTEGRSKGEIATRPFLDKRYPQLFWLHMGFILFFWRDDDSAGFEMTDAAIEKSVNLAFDMIGKGAVDAAIDFGKFLYQSKK